jgi:hypothetical protein
MSLSEGMLKEKSLETFLFLRIQADTLLAPLPTRSKSVLFVRDIFYIGINQS